MTPSGEHGSLSKGAIRQRRYRARKKLQQEIDGYNAELERVKAAKTGESPIPPLSQTPIADLAKWSRNTLRVPPGHPSAGEPMELPEFGIRFLEDAWNARESGLFVARKNAKSAICAVYLLGRLCGPLRQRGWRGGICSVNKDKAGELKRQMQEIAEASELSGLTFYRSPVPGRVESPAGTLDILSADKSAGHASGFDDVLVDELGLLAERDRALINGLRTSISARNGRFVAISILGDAPFPREMIERRDDSRCAVHLYAAEPDARLDDEAAWAAANPGLGTIKSLEYMRDESRRVMQSPADQGHFRAFDLNQADRPRGGDAGTRAGTRRRRPGAAGRGLFHSHSQ